MTSVTITIYFLLGTQFTGLTRQNKTRVGGVLTAIGTSLGSCSSKCVWVEIPTADGINVLIGYHYFKPETKS
jgi:hypothetical protein